MAAAVTGDGGIGTARVRVPASSANLGPGFDAVGLALGLYDEYEARLTPAPGLVLEVSGEGEGTLPLDESHLVARAMKVAVEAAGGVWLPADGPGLHLRCRNAIPMAAGLGSSATALVGGLGLGFALTGGGALTPAVSSLVNTHAGLLEGHPDNSSASVYGGLTLSWLPSEHVVRTVRIDVHPDLDVLVLVPGGSRLSTREARAALPPGVPYRDAVRQATRSALLVHALTADPSILLDATQDWLHQEYRREQYPVSMTAVDRLRAEGYAAVVSGAGPSVLVLAERGVLDDVRTRLRTLLPETEDRWTVLRPGVATTGLTLEVG